MARIVFALNQSLDGYVDHMAFAPDPVLFQHFIDDVRSLSGTIYGRRMYETMRYWDDDHAEWNAAERSYAHAWRDLPKWVVSRTLTEVGPNATLISDNPARAIGDLKAQREGLMEVAGPELAGSLTELAMIDEYRLYIHPRALGHGKPFFTGPSPRLRLTDALRIGDDVIRLSYVVA